MFARKDSRPRRDGGADLRARRRANSLQELRTVPPSRRSRSVLITHVRRRKATRAADCQSHLDPLHAAVAARAGTRAVCRRAAAERRADRHAGGLAARRVSGGSAVGLPPVPTFTPGWQLGEPDLVLTAPEPFMLPPDGVDTFWNVVLPASVTRTRYVRAIEILPGNKQVVHHANVILDRGGMGRALDAKAPGPGFPGMDIEVASSTFEPDSHFLFWKPGTPAVPEPADMAWRLDPSTDLILNMHLQPSGRSERIQPSIGLHFTDSPPTRVPMLLQLEHDGALDIPPGDAAFTVTDELQLPVDVQVLGVYPHAHYLGKVIEGTARLPDGTTRWLIRIPDWDLNWQAVYQLAEPLSLPKGTVLSMRWTFDNSVANERNPSTPPQRVRAGDRSTDEMAHLWVQVLPRQASDRLALQEALMRARLRNTREISWRWQTSVRRCSPLNGSRRRSPRSSRRWRRAQSRRRTEQPRRRAAGGRPERTGDRAIHALTLQANPGDLDASYNLGLALLAHGQPQQALPHLDRVAHARPGDGRALAAVGTALAMTGRFARASTAYTRALELAPDNAEAHFNIGLLEARRGRRDEAIRHFETAQRLDPSNAETAAALREARAERSPHSPR